MADVQHFGKGWVKMTSPCWLLGT